MLVVAVSEMNMSPSEFWELSWYEWGLYLLRLKSQREREKQEWETNWDRTRVMWATLVNINSGKGKKVKPSDLIKLSYDDKVKEAEIPNPGDVIKRFKEKINGGKRTK